MDRTIQVPKAPALYTHMLTRNSSKTGFWPPAAGCLQLGKAHHEDALEPCPRLVRRTLRYFESAGIKLLPVYF